MMTLEVIPMKRTVSHRALLGRINRTLQSEGKQMRRSRKSDRDYKQFGAYYVVNDKGVTEHHVDLAEYAKKLHLLKPYEVLESEEKQ
jgi:hypothetical protein